MNKLFGIAIDSIDKSYQGVQIGHAIGKCASSNPEVDWDNQTFVYLKTSELNLQKLLLKLEEKGINFHAFIEPDIGNKLTAIACLTNEYNIFKKLELF